MISHYNFQDNIGFSTELISMVFHLSLLHLSYLNSLATLVYPFMEESSLPTPIYPSTLIWIGLNESHIFFYVLRTIDILRGKTAKDLFKMTKDNLITELDHDEGVQLYMELQVQNGALTVRNYSWATAFINTEDKNFILFSLIFKLLLIIHGNVWSIML